MICTIFGNRIKELRKEMFLSQLELAQRSGIDRSQICKIEQGKVNVTLETMLKLSTAFNKKISDLLPDQDNSLKPFVKWAGGKTQILSKLKELMPEKFETYYEPFVGGGAFFLSMAPKKAYIADSNEELICVYECLKDDKLYTKFIDALIEHEEKHNEEYYTLVRNYDRSDNFKNKPIYLRAARMVYLNKACFNGLYRVNSKGYFNVPSAKKEKITAFDRDNMNKLHNYFMNNNIKAFCGDYTGILENAKENDFVYLDPPYDVEEDKDNFTSYTSGAFDREEQKRLYETFVELDKKGVKVMLSNSNTSFIRNLYKDYNITTVLANRMINSDASNRKAVEEVIITNYQNNIAE